MSSIILFDKGIFPVLDAPAPKKNIGLGRFFF